MEIQSSWLKGYWKREDTGAIYKFSERTLVIRSGEIQKAFKFEVRNKRNMSYLIIERVEYVLSVFNHNHQGHYFKIITKQGERVFNKVEGWE